MYAARGVWLLLYFSHENVWMLDGDFEKWKKERYSIEFKSNPLKYSKFRVKIDVEILATSQDVMRSLNNKNVVIVDARFRQEYNGSEVRAAKRDHIASAVNFDWQNNIENAMFKSKKKLTKISKIPKNAQIVTYCQRGYRAANAFIVLKMLGYDNVKMYLWFMGRMGKYPTSSCFKWNLVDLIILSAPKI
jgi:thiosulfate/3-mercaptopyruvate sulfurtransferase